MTNFYSRPCGRGDRMRELYARQKLISTHAPAGGATFITSTAGTIREISTHAPAGGATRRRSTGWRTTAQNFYSRPCGRGDFPGRSHAGRRCLYFYSRPCGRGDRAGSPRYGLCADFYSRPCGRGDSSKARRRKSSSENFYSRPCGRGDQTPGLLRRRGQISTHAPAGGATEFEDRFQQRLGISTHAPAGGATMRIHTRRRSAKFLLTPLREGRHGEPLNSATATVFLLTPLREGRRRRAESLSHL